jgi:protein TonB
MAASAGESYSGPVPEPLRAIPVLQVQLNRDGSVLDILVLRTPAFSPETIDMAKKAVLRAAPFGPVDALPRPWQFTETFLYDEQLRFTLRSLVE